MLDTLIAFLALIFGASVTGGNIVGGSVNVPQTWQPAEVAREKACQDLIDDGDPDTKCNCSETFNVDDDIQALGSINWNPSNSPTGAGETQCDRDDHDGSSTVSMGIEWEGEADTIRTAGSEVPFSTGADPYVYLGALKSTHNMWVHAQDFTDQTACTRFYRRYSPGTRMLAGIGNSRIKVGTLSRDAPGNHANFAASDAVGLTTYWHTNVIDNDATPGNTTHNVGLENAMVECSDDAWCRIQICADHNASANTLKFRFYLKGLGISLDYFYESDHTSAPATVSYGSGRSGPQFFVGTVGGELLCRPDCHQYTSHAMAVVVPFDTSYTIPPACELETPGGCDP